jgi:type II secretory pathway pseudopilin PulG
MDKKFLKSESAVSEVIGFIMIFSIVILAISAIYAVGYPTIQSSKENAQFQNMEQSFMVLQSNINTVAFGQAPVRTLKTSLGGGSLTVYPDAGWSKINISTTTGYSCKVNIGAIEYEKNGRSIAYEGGGVWEKYPAGSAITVSEPRIFVHGDNGNRTVSVSIINISSENGISSVGGEGAASVVVRFKRSSSPYINSTSSPYPVTITVTSDYADAWERYFNETIDPSMGVVEPVGGTGVKATISAVNTLIVNEHVIEVEVS